MWPFKKNSKNSKPIYNTITITLNSEDDFETRAEKVLRASGIVIREELMETAIPNMAEILENYSKIDAHAVESNNNQEADPKE